MPDRWHRGVRTTLTLDDEVAAKLFEAEVNRTGTSLKQVANESLRDGGHADVELGLEVALLIGNLEPIERRARAAAVEPPEARRSFFMEPVLPACGGARNPADSIC